MLDPTYPLYPIVTFLCFVLVLIPLPWHLQAWNVGTCAYMLWTAVACLNQFVNSVVWRDNAINVAPVWCDISSRLIVATSVALPAASFTITRRLYRITRVQTVMLSQKEKRQEMTIDLSVCFGFPLFVMGVLYWFVQGHRFNIIEQLGCFPTAVNTLPTYFLIWSWPLVLGLASMVYCVLTVTALLRRRKEMSQFLNSNSQITFSRYFRLMILASMDTVFTVPLAAFAIWLNAVESEIAPWRGLADVHWGFSRIEQIPAVVWRLDRWTVISLGFNRAAIILCAAVFIGFFGWAEETRKNYAKLYWMVMKRFGYVPKPKASMFTNSSVAVHTPHLPMMSAQGGLKVLVSTGRKVQKRDSFLSSVGDLSSSFTVDTTYDERKDEKSPTKTSSSDSLPASPDDIELHGLPHLHNEPSTTEPGLTAPTRPPRCASLGNIV